MFKNVLSWNVGSQWNIQVVLCLHSHPNQLLAHLRAPCSLSTKNSTVYARNPVPEHQRNRGQYPRFPNGTDHGLVPVSYLSGFCRVRQLPRCQ